MLKDTTSATAELLIERKKDRERISQSQATYRIDCHRFQLTVRCSHSDEGFSFAVPSLGRRVSFTARIERAPSDRARSASKKDIWPLPHLFPIFASSAK